MLIVKVPGFCSEETRGCKNSGNAVLAELRRIRFNEQGKSIAAEQIDFEEIHIDNSNADMKEKLILKNAFEIFSTNEKVIFLGGDHSITFPLAKAFLSSCRNKELKPCLIVLDAHADCSDITATADRKWIFNLLKSGFSGENMLIVGARSFMQDELAFIKEKGVKMLEPNRLREAIADVTDGIMEFAYGKELYFSIDVNVVDPAFAPAVFHKEVVGLTSRELLYIVSRISLMKNLRVGDILGIDSESDKTGSTVKLGAKIVSEII